MKRETGNLYAQPEHPLHIPCITTNSVITRSGDLVMGAGSALAAKKAFPGIERQAGGTLYRAGESFGRYGFKVMSYQRERSGPTRFVGLFQTKVDFMDRSDLELIRQSAEMLGTIAKRLSKSTFHVPFPGVGRGGLREDEVLPILETLPDNVVIWTL